MPTLRRTRPCRTTTATPASGFNGAMPDFNSLYNTYRRRIFSQCFWMLRNQGDAEDAAQEVFLRLFLKAHTFRGESNLSTWLYRLTTNCVLMEMRKKRRHGQETPPRDSLGEMPSSDTKTDLALSLLQAPPVPILERVTIGTAVAQLPVGYQEILELHDVQGHTHGEIAKILGIHAGTSKSQLHKARMRLRRLLQNRGTGAPIQQAKHAS